MNVLQILGAKLNVRILRLLIWTATLLLIVNGLSSDLLARVVHLSNPDVAESPIVDALMLNQTFTGNFTVDR